MTRIKTAFKTYEEAENWAEKKGLTILMIAKKDDVVTLTVTEDYDENQD